MRLFLNLFLLLVCAGIAYLIYGNIKEPILFEKEYKARQGAVVKQLEKIREAQEIYKRVTGEYAANFDTLKQVLRTDSIAILKIVGNLDDENSVAQIDTLYESASDSIAAMGISIDSLDFVPYGEPGAAYSIDADTMTFQSTLVNVVEVGIKKNQYMGEFADKRYQKYNPMYNPDDFLKFGDMNSPNTSGNWRN